MNMENKDGFYKTSAWLKCREGYIKSVGGLCERCLQEGKIVPGYIVHHKIEITADNVNDPSITLNWDNLEYVCLHCHNTIHFNTSPKKRYEVLPDGGVKIIS